jgi:hypothetical protein
MVGGADFHHPVPNLGGGVDEGTSLMHLPPNTASSISNIDYPYHPAASARAGSAKLNAAAMSANAVTGLSDMGLSTATRITLAKCGTVLYKWNTGTSAWDSKKTGLTAGNARFLTYKDTVLMFGPDAPLKSTDGATWTALGGSPPTAKYCALHEDRVFAANASGSESTVYHSQLADMEDWSTTSGDDAAGSFVVDTNDGTVITGLWSLPGFLGIGKDRAFYLLQGTGPHNYKPDFVTRRSGPVNQEAGVVTPSGQFYYVGHDGIYLFDASKNQSPQQIQRPVQTTFDTLNGAQLARVAAGYTNKGGVERVFFAIPTGSATAPDKTLVYYPRWGIWSVWSGITPYIFASSASGSILQLSNVDYLAWGDTAGFVWKGLTGTQDGSTDVAWSWVSGGLTFGKPWQKYVLAELLPFARVESSGTLSVAYDDAMTGSFGTAATVNLATETPLKRLTCPFATAEAVMAYLFRLKLYGTAGPCTIEHVTARAREAG